MRIGIDVQSTTGNPSGLGLYTGELIRSLAGLDKDNEYVHLSSAGFHGNLRAPSRMTWEQIVLPFLAAVRGVDILHVPGFAPPLLHPGTLVTTVHDLIGMRMPENNLTPVSRFYWGAYLKTFTRLSDRIITDSEHSKNDIVELLGVPPARVTVIPLAAPAGYRVVDDTAGMARVRAAYGIGDYPYVLCTGNIEYRKNVGAVIAAWNQVRFPVKHKLVLCGAKAKFTGTLMNSIRAAGIEADVILTGYVPLNDLITLYNGARVFVYPSLYEGFGLPVLEAMACGLPVVTSNTTSIPEVAGDAALLVDPQDPDAIADGVGRLLNDTGLHAALRERGLARAKQFSWERTARETLRVYRELA